MSDEQRRPSLEERLAVLRARLEEGLPTRAAELRAAADRLVTSGAPAARDEIRRLAHRLRGTAGSHGLDALSAEAAELEQLAASSADAAAVVARALALVTAIRRVAADARTEASSPPARASAPGHALAGRRVLALDDDPPTRRLLALTLVTMGGADARIVERPEDALEHLDRDVFDLVIVDAMMPSMTGLEFVAAARGRAQGARGVYAFLSAATPDELGWTVPARAHWLRKPFRPRELVDALVTIVGGGA